jgi:membrane-bound metal-dependent hydrolase YbcI (DUF457 family)
LSWAAHDLEPYVLRAKLGARISLPMCLIGSYSPDIATKWLVYGVSLGGDRLRVSDPVQFHRGWPGVGFTHSYAFGMLISALILALTRSRVLAFSFLIGQWLHVTSDMLDSVGVMATFPFSTHHVSTDTYAYAGELGRLSDAHAYYTSLGGICDLLFVLLLIPYWRVLTRDYFDREVITTDPAFIWLRGKVGMLPCRTLYHCSAFFGVTSVFGWLIWALVWNHWHVDWGLGGPNWVPRVGGP